MTKSRTKKEKNERPFLCEVCKSYFKTTEELRAHLDSEHKSVKVIENADGSWTIDKRNMAKSKPKDKPATTAKAKPEEPKPKRVPEPDAKLTNWSKADDDTKAKVKKFVLSEIKKIQKKSPDDDTLRAEIGWAYGKSKLGAGLCRRIAERFRVNLFEEGIAKLAGLKLYRLKKVEA